MANRDTASAGGGSNRGTAEKAKDTATDVKDKAQEKVSSAAAEARDRGEELVHEGKEKAREMGDRASEEARSRADQQKDRVSEGIRSVASALRRGGDELSDEHSQYGGFLNTVADRAEGVSRYLDERNVESLTRDARRMARDHTPVFLSGAFTLGMLGARFLKSSGDQARTGRYDGPAEPYEPGPRTGTQRRYGSPSAGSDYGRYQTEERYQTPQTERSAGTDRSQNTGEGGYA